MNTFQRFVEDCSNGSWVILFAKSPIDIVSTTYSKMVSSEVEKNIVVEFEPNNSEEQWQPDGTIVKVVDSDWTIIFHQVGEWSEFNSKLLSRKLSTKVLEFSGEDTSGVVGCTLFDPELKAPIEYTTAGDSEYLDEIYEEAVEHAHEADLDDFPQLVNGSNIVSSYDDLFQSLGIKTVRVYLNKSRDKALIEDKQVKIERVDILKNISYE